MAAIPKIAMVFAAGLGARMRPLTLSRPKALIEVGGKALIDHTLDRLEAAGVTKAVVNVHAFADQMQAHLGGGGQAGNRAGILRNFGPHQHDIEDRSGHRG